jgi:hypothetical protein
VFNKSKVTELTFFCNWNSTEGDYNAQEERGNPDA